MMKVKPAGIINKHDLSESMSAEIEGFFLENGVQVCGRLSYSAEIPKIQRLGVAPVLSAEVQTRRQLRSICSQVIGQAGLAEGLRPREEYYAGTR
jgi:MinD superfamily P-loop ATPase